jgi:hypothetical protein
LKRLRGTPITRHTAEFAMAYDPQTPYTILQNSTIDFVTMQRINRFARYWEMVANSGRFAQGSGCCWRPARPLVISWLQRLAVVDHRQDA